MYVCILLEIRNRRLQLEALAHLVQLLPVANRDTLYVLLKLLSTISLNAKDTNEGEDKVPVNGNRMDSFNLATVIAPNILHCVQPGQLSGDTELEDRFDVINVVKFVVILKQKIQIDLFKIKFTTTPSCRALIDHWEDMFSVPPDVLDDVFTIMMDLFPRQLDYLCDRRADNYK